MYLKSFSPAMKARPTVKLKPLALFFAALTVSSSALAWQPDRPVEFVVTSGAGGGTDTFARTVQSIIGKHQLMDKSVIVSNKGGGSGAEGYVYSASSNDDPYKLTFGTNNEYLLPEVGEMPYAADDLQPVASMAMDEFLIWVKGDAKYASAKDFIDAAKQNPGKMQFAGSQSKDTDQTLVSMIEETTDTDFRYVPFNGGSQALVPLAGGHGMLLSAALAACAMADAAGAVLSCEFMLGMVVDEGGPTDCDDVYTQVPIVHARETPRNHECSLGGV